MHFPCVMGVCEWTELPDVAVVLVCTWTSSGIPSVMTGADQMHVDGNSRYLLSRTLAEHKESVRLGYPGALL